MSAPACSLRATNLARQLRLAQPRVTSAFTSRTRAISTRRPFHSTNTPREPENSNQRTQWQTKHHNNQTNDSRGGHQKSQNVLLAGASGASLVVLGVAVSNHESAEGPQPTGEDQIHASPADGRDPSRPRHRLSDIREQHGPGSKNPWVTFEDKVYDITDWVGAHPGGDVILRAAGGSIEPYWDIFTIHKATHVREILDQYMIGYIAIEDLDQRTGRPAAEAIEDPFSTDPERDQRLIKHTAKPCNAEPPPEELGKDFITPPELFYVRNHMWVPVVKEDQADDHALTIELPDGEERVYTLAELRSRFRLHRVTAALQCSGNRRSDMTSSTAATNGLQWGVGAISNANWEGVRLADVLLDAGLKPAQLAPTEMTTDGKGDADSEMHVQFSALEAYGASIPLSTALDPRADVLLAFGMNGKPLPRDHGYPLRTIVPGHVAARSVKWLNKIVVSDEESPSQWQRRDYKCFGPNEGSKPDWDRYPAIQEMPITSATTGVWVGDCVRAAAAAAKSGTEWMLRRTDEARAAPGVRDLPAWQREHLHSKDHKYAPKMDGPEGGVPVALTGYAYSGGGKHIIRVDVSIDGGNTWAQAELLDDCGPGGKNCKGSKYWAWRRWRYVGSLPELHETQGDKKCTTILVKATDSAYNTQPEQHTGIYNVRGNLATAWHRLLICPSCVKKPDGKTTWCTGNGVYGSGFSKPEATVTKA